MIKFDRILSIANDSFLASDFQDTIEKKKNEKTKKVFSWYLQVPAK